MVLPRGERTRARAYSPRGHSHDAEARGRHVKLIVAYINPFKLDEVRDALKETGVTGLSASNIQGFGRQAGHTETYRGNEYEMDFVPQGRIEVLAEGRPAPPLRSTRWAP